MGSRYTMGRGNFAGKGASHCKVWGHSVVMCAKMAEPIKMPFGLWTPVGPRKHVLNGAQISHVEGQLLGDRTLPGMPVDTATSCAKMAEPINLPFGLRTRVGRRKHEFNRIHQVAPMGGHINATWRIRLNRPSESAMWPYVKLL